MIFFFLTTTLIIAFYHFLFLFRSDLFGDEITSIFYANSYSFKKLLLNPIESISTNLYYLVLKFFALILDNTSFFKFIHAAIFLISILVLLNLVKLFRFNLNQKLVFIGPFLTSLYFLRHIYSLRMYSFGFLLFILSFSFLYKFLFNSKHLNKNFFYLSLLMDLIGFLFVYGYVVWIVIKFVFLFLIKKLNILKIENKFIFLSFISMSLFLTYLLFLYLGHFDEFSVHLSWVRVPTFADFGLSFLSLSGFGFSEYFEYWSYITNNMKILGIIFSFVEIILSIYFFIRLKKDLLDLGNKKTKTILIKFTINLLFFISLVSLFLNYILNVVFSTNFFHIRQLFIIAGLFSFYFGYVIANMTRNKFYQAFLIYLFMVVFFLRYNSNTYYTRIFLPKLNDDGKVLIISRDETEIAYYLCSARSYQDMDRLCGDKNIVVSDGPDFEDERYQKGFSLAKDKLFYFEEKGLLLDGTNCEILHGGYFQCSLGR